ncbi:substrate-binding periplasmic protein [Undibacterium sp. Di27W]|uniref:substrate-binding periplasmic protein n=1 Tax=Undibacterium sp. Di27W TaxID=3413036 RepID=UPI003BF32736
MIKVYSYHLKPPLILDQATGRGLYNDMLSYLNKENTGYRFELIYLPRRRLDLLVNSGQLDGLVIGVNPVWFNDKEEQKFLWTLPVMNDIDEVVSSKNRPFEFTGAKSMNGMRIGLVLGYYYFGVNELIAEGKILRDDASSEEHSFRKLMAGRIDAAIISRSNYDYEMKNHPELQGLFHISKNPHDQYDRQILIPLHMTKVQQQINIILRNAANDPIWQKLINAYR